MGINERVCFSSPPPSYICIPVGSERSCPHCTPAPTDVCLSYFLRMSVCTSATYIAGTGMSCMHAMDMCANYYVYMHVLTQHFA